MAIPEAERAVLGALLLCETPKDAAALIASAGDLRPEHFSVRECGAVWEIGRTLVEAGQLPDPITVSHALVARTKAGKAEVFVGALLDGLPRVHNVSQWARLVQDHDAEYPAARSVLVLVSSVEAELVQWEWMHRIPRAKVTVLDGDPGLGKSTLALDLAARRTRGLPMPGDERELDPAGAVFLTAEDGIADTLRPRLEAAGADLDRVAVLTAVRDEQGRPRLPVIPDDVEHVREAVRKMRARFLVIDPLMAFLNRRVDSHRDQDVRGALALLSDLAERERIAVIIIRHLNKAGGGHPMYRGGGSIGIIGAARAGLLVAPDPRDSTRRVLAVSKSNLGPIPPSLAYRLVAAGDTSRLEWEGITDWSAGDLLAAQRDDGDGAGPREEAEGFLRELLADGPVRAKRVRAQAEGAGLSWMTVRRAADRLGVTREKAGGHFGGDPGWFWSLKVFPKAEDAHPQNESTFSSEGEHLQEPTPSRVRGSL